MSTKKLTQRDLMKIVKEEVAKFGAMKSTTKAAKETEEIDADEFADSLENHIDHYKALGLEESRLVKRLTKIRETKTTTKQKIEAAKK